jgi:glycine/D-amino acid oxidase-like deaminating enzyme
MLPIIGRDFDVPWLFYACGHSKNGILLAPATARAVVALAQDKRPEWDLAPFSISRFSSGE